jgi:uncharacterized repeat protein (TIGR03803 family)
MKQLRSLVRFFALVLSAMFLAPGGGLHAQTVAHIELHKFQPSSSTAFAGNMTALPDGSVLVVGGGTGLAPPIIARVSPDGTTAVLAYEGATEALVPGAGGYYYGVGGGPSGIGRLFRMALDGSVNLLHDYTGGADGFFPMAIRRGPDGTVYVSSGGIGVDCGYPVLTIRPDGTVTPAAFRVPGPVLAAESDGAVVGIAGCPLPNGRVVYRRSPGGTVSTVVAFEAEPGDLIVTSVGTIVGYSSSGGGDTCRFFRIAGGHIEFVHTLDRGCGADSRPPRERGTTGEVYLVVGGQIWRVAADGAVSSVLVPAAGTPRVIDAVPFQDGRIAAIREGGAYGGGELITLPASGGTAVSLAAFSPGNPDGADPRGPLVQDADGYLYGTTRRGGQYDCGTIYRLSRAGAFRVMYTFSGIDGCEPQGLVQTADGAMFGSTARGTNHSGTLFRVGRSGALTTLFVFRYEHHGFAPGPLAVGPDGHLYGRTARGGRPTSDTQPGTVFRLTPNGSFTTIHYFSPEDSPHGISNGQLLAASDGQLYGTTQSCSPLSIYCGNGNLFRLSTSGAFARLVTFPYEEPFQTLVQGSDGRIYGSTQSSPFALTTSGTLTRFPTVGSRARLQTLAPDGRLYGALQHGGVFSMTPNGVADMNPVPSLTDVIVSTLLDGRDGFLYGSSAPPYQAVAGAPVGLLFKVPLPPLPPPRNLRFVR